MAKELTIKEAADVTGAAVSTLSKWCRRGKFKNARKVWSPIGDYWVIPESELKGIEIKPGRPRK